MYFLLAGAFARFHLLRYGLSFILIFVGLKMSWLNAAWQGISPAQYPSRCDRWRANGIHRSVAGFSRLPHAERPSD
jgi:hypothetical protein